MCRLMLAAIALGIAVSPLQAAEEKQPFDLNGDRFMAGSAPINKTTGADDLFMAGATVRSEEAINGSAHLAGRKIVVTGAIGGDAYAAGMDVTVNKLIAGDATLAGYNVDVSDVAGDLRISGANLTIAGPVSGTALISGRDVRISSVLGGDVRMTAKKVAFDDGARIDGRLTLFEEKPGTIEIPESVISSDRIERMQATGWSAARVLTFESFTRALLGFLIGIVAVAAVASLIAALVPGRLADLRRSILARPWRTLFYGLLTESMIIGATLILFISVIGLPLAPAAVLLALIAVFAGYVVASYAVGVGLLMAIGRPEPGSFGARALSAGVGALTVGVIALIPLIGWVVVMAVALTGVGAIALRLFRPKFFATT
ncbi:MAG: hypothetical protein AAGE61_00410 [Pseudomonadota bacterium]